MCVRTHAKSTPMPLCCRLIVVFLNSSAPIGRSGFLLAFERLDDAFRDP
jgi:hypothetical protein